MSSKTPTVRDLELPFESSIDESVRLLKNKKVLREIAENRNDLLEAADNLVRHVRRTEEHLTENSQLVEAWRDLGLWSDDSDDELEPPKKEEDGSDSPAKPHKERKRIINFLTGQFDESIFGPPVKGKTSDDRALEIQRIIFRKEQDFTEAVIHIGRDTFLSNPLMSCRQDVLSMQATAAEVYSTVRELFVSLGKDHGLPRFYQYREMIRCIRSQLYLTQVLNENLGTIEERMEHLDVVREKYEGTIFTLRRQLEDFHKALGTVGRDANGQYKVLNAPPPGESEASGGGSGVADGKSEKTAEQKTIVIIQTEDLGILKTRQRQLHELALKAAHEVILNLANAFGGWRTNYMETRMNTAVPSCYMFAFNEACGAIAFSCELHNVLRQSHDWPQALLSMTKFSQELWRGVRVRVGVHFGPLTTMEVAHTGTNTTHYEGVTVDKCMRLTSLAVAGDTIVSSALQDRYQLEKRTGQIPTTTLYQGLRNLVMNELQCHKKRGFKKGEMCFRYWANALAARIEQPFEADFEIVSFFGLESGNSKKEDVADDEPLTVEELMAAKESEMAVMQLELDNLRLAVIKRDQDMEDFKTSMSAMLAKLQRRTNLRQTEMDHLNGALESQLMDSHDVLSAVLPALEQYQLMPIAARSSMEREPSPVKIVDDEMPSPERSLCASLSSSISRTQSIVARPDASLVVRGSTRSLSNVRKGGETSTPLSPRANTTASVTPRIEKPAPVIVASPPRGYTMRDGNADLEKAEEKKKQRREDVLESVAEAAPPAASLSAPVEKESGSAALASGGPPAKHKNQVLWRELNGLVSGAAKKVMGQQKLSQKGAERLQAKANTGGHSSPVLRVHSILRVYVQLIRRFTTESSAVDSANQSINEDQFIQLFMRLVAPDGLMGNVRELMNLLTAAAIEDTEVELANANDDARLTKSVAAHLAKMFNAIRPFKKYAIVVQNNQNQQFKRSEGDTATDGSGSPPPAMGLNGKPVVGVKGIAQLLTAGALAGKRTAGGVSPSVTPRVNIANEAKLREELGVAKDELTKLKAAMQRMTKQNQQLKKQAASNTMQGTVGGAAGVLTESPSAGDPLDITGGYHEMAAITIPGSAYVTPRAGRGRSALSLDDTNSDTEYDSHPEPSDPLVEGGVAPSSSSPPPHPQQRHSSSTTAANSSAKKRTVMPQQQVFQPLNGPITLAPTVTSMSSGAMLAGPSGVPNNQSVFPSVPSNRTVHSRGGSRPSPQLHIIDQDIRVDALHLGGPVSPSEHTMHPPHASSSLPPRYEHGGATSPALIAEGDEVPRHSRPLTHHGHPFPSRALTPGPTSGRVPSASAYGAMLSQQAAENIEANRNNMQRGIVGSRRAITPPVSMTATASTGKSGAMLFMLPDPNHPQPQHSEGSPTLIDTEELEAQRKSIYEQLAHLQKLKDTSVALLGASRPASQHLPPQQQRGYSGGKVIKEFVGKETMSVSPLLGTRLNGPTTSASLSHPPPPSRGGVASSKQSSVLSVVVPGIAGGAVYDPSSSSAPPMPRFVVPSSGDTPPPGTLTVDLPTAQTKSQMVSSIVARHGPKRRPSVQ